MPIQVCCAPATLEARHRLRTALSAILVPAALLLPIAIGGTAFGGDDGKAPSSAPTPKPTKKNAPSAAGEHAYDPDNVTAISQYVESLNKAVEKFQAQERTAAIDGIRKAITLNPRHPLGHYLLGEVYAASGNLSEAEAALSAARELGNDKHPVLRGHVLFALADVYERQKKWEDAKTTWQAYSEYAAKVGADAGVHPQSAAERLKVAQKIIDLEKAYVVVRERIAAEKELKDAGAAAPAPAKPPAKK